MTARRSILALAIVLALVASLPAKAAAAEVPTPESFLGFTPGADRQLASWPQVLAYLKAVDAASDRVTIELAGSSPGYRAAWRTTPPRHCASGAAVPTAGAAWLEVRLDPAQAHDAQGRATLETRPQAQPGLTAVRALQMTCDFEGVVSWAVGAPRALPFRVMPLADPPRVVVDVGHATAATASP